ncbi:MAG: hypothetical protein GSR77_02395 [Desulfurococcales archaeon]|nr:hypothetical protein [Desulfurococcales archaeon]
MRLFTDTLSALTPSSCLEIGVGVGFLTLYSSRIVPRIIGVEIDRSLVQASQEILLNTPNVLVVLGDGLRMLDAWRESCLYSNTPYNLTSQIIARSAKNNNIDVLVLGVQYDLARRILAYPGSKDYGRLTVITRLFFDVEQVGFIPRSWFYPVPKVESSVLLLKRKRPWKPEYNVLEQFTACLFSQRNRRASKIVERCAPGTRHDIDPGIRVRDLDPETILSLIEEQYN